VLAFSWIGVGVQLLEDADGAIHTASPGDATTAGPESAVVDAVIDAFAGTGKPYIEISGLWVYGRVPSRQLPSVIGG
jgi:hypothetical protein